MEVIVALAVVTTGVISGLTLTTYNLTSTVFSQRRLVAANLAREGIEVVRQIRDSNWLNGQDWNQGIAAPNEYRLTIDFDPALYDPAGSVWTFSPVTQTVDIEDCDDCLIYLDPDSGIYSHDSVGTPTSYKRLITIQEICWQDVVEDEVVLTAGSLCSDTPYELVGWQVNSQVTWAEAGREHQLSMIDQLYDWR